MSDLLPAEVDVPPSQAASFQRAARALLERPLVLADDADFPHIRRFRAPLADRLERVLGATFELGPTCARLRRPVDGLDRHLELRAPGRDRSFDRRRLAYLCLTLAALSRVAEVVTLTDLAATVRPWADETPRLGFDATLLGHRRAFVDVLLWLGQHGVVRTVEETKEAWAADPEAGEVLYRIDHDALSALTEPPPLLDEMPSAAGLVRRPAADVSHRLATERRRQRLARLLVDRPVVHFDDLHPDDAALARREGGRLAADLEDLTGRVLERRAEGLALVAPSGTFPRPSVHATVALALCAELAENTGLRSAEVAWPHADDEQAALVGRLDDARPVGPAPRPPLADTVGLEATPPSLPAVPLAVAEDLVARLVAENGHGLGEQHRSDPRHLADAALALLEAHRLVHRLPGLVVPLPALARYRAVAITRSRPAVAEPDQGELGADLFTTEPA